MNTPHVLFIVTNANVIGPNKRKTGYFFPEVAHPWEAFENAGVAVEYASPLGGATPSDGYDENDPAQRAFKESKAIHRMNRSRKLSEINVLDYDAIFFPGGLGQMVDITKDPDVKRAITEAWEGGLLVGAVCHGPAALLGLPLIKGKKLTGFSNEEEEGYAKADVPFLLESALREQGAIYESAAPWHEKVVVDGRLMTGQNPASAGPLAREMVAYFTRAR